MSLLKTMDGREYTLSEAAQAGGRLYLSDLKEEELFAELALDVTAKEIAERLFTYVIPVHLRNEVFVGSQVLVPFGKQELVSAFVVSIRDRHELLRSASSGSNVQALPEKVRAISEVLDSNPLFEPRYIEFLYWISEYYLCSISDVLTAAIPAEIGARVKRMVRLLNPEGEDGVNGKRAGKGERGQTEGTAVAQKNELAELFGLNQSPVLKNSDEQILHLLQEAANSGKDLSFKALRDRSQLSNQSFYSTVARLRRRGLLEIFGQQEESASPKIEKHIIWTGEEAKSSRQKEILDYLKRHNGSLPQKQLIEETKCTSSTIKRMVSEGILSIQEVDSFRDPLRRLAGRKDQKPELTDSQSQVLSVLLEQLSICLDKVENLSPPAKEIEAPWLLHGVTGSGKTEVYLRLIEETLNRGQSALMMVPEISLTPQLAQRLVGRFGEQVAVWHSALSAGERYDSFRRIQSGELRVVLGARSAILANIPNLGLIILDEEHDGSYKQSTPNPRYSAKHLALERARRQGCFVLFGSATPDSGTYFAARDARQIVSLPERVHKQALPESIFVDMRQEYLRGNKSIISLTLQEELKACFERKEQAILLINRRGYASHLFCKSCGQVVNCKHCSVSLVFHNGKPSAEDNLRSGGNFSCHHCGFSMAATDICPSCSSPFLKQAGMGTQKVEAEMRHLFPEARIVRLDSDISARKGAYEEIFEDFSAGKADVLIGTQMVAKGLDIARVTLVGVLAADAAFNLPDFRSLERGFQLLTQVSGRAGRGEFPGRVILQTHNLELPALHMAKDQDYDTFIQSELTARKEFDYPPYSQLIRIVGSSPDPHNLQSALDQLCEELSNYLEELESVKILGPAACLIERIKGQYRQHIIIKNMMGEPGRLAISGFLKRRSFQGSGVRITVDIDPVDLI